MKYKEFINAVHRAYMSQNVANFYLREVNRLLVYREFGDDPPQASICAGLEFIVVWRGWELLIEEAVDIIASRGYLLPSDFKV